MGWLSWPVVHHSPHHLHSTPGGTCGAKRAVPRVYSTRTMVTLQYTPSNISVGLAAALEADIRFRSVPSHANNCGRRGIKIFRVFFFQLSYIICFYFLYNNVLVSILVLITHQL